MRRIVVEDPAQPLVAGRLPSAPHLPGDGQPFQELSGHDDGRFQVEGRGLLRSRWPLDSSLSGATLELIA